jgi:hypothetical protein
MPTAHIAAVPVAQRKLARPDSMGRDDKVGNDNQRLDATRCGESSKFPPCVENRKKAEKADNKVLVENPNPFG